MDKNNQKFIDSVSLINIMNCFKRYNMKINFIDAFPSDKVKYPFIIISVSYDRCKYVLNLGIIRGHLAGNGHEYELIQRNNRFIIGKLVNEWIS